MKKLLISLCLVLCIATTAWAGAIFDGGGIIASEVDGSPLAFVYKVILPNGTLSITSGVATLTIAGGTPTAITVANEATDTTCFPLFAISATGDLGPKTNAGLAFNSNTGMLTATGFTGPLTGLASTTTALAANGANCNAGYAPLGVDASGAAESCWQPQPIDAMLTALAALTSTEGSIVYFSAADTPVVLAKGAAYQRLRTNSGTTAPEWEYPQEVIVSLSSGKTLAKAEFCGTTVILTGTGTYLYPTITSDMVGCKARFKVRGAYTASLDFPATVVPWLAGTALTAANKVTSSGLTGDGIDVVITTTTAVEADNANGVWIDGGA